MDNYKITVADEVLEYAKKDATALDIVPMDDRNFHLLKDNRSYAVEVVRTDYLNKTFKIKVNGNTYEVALEDAYDQMVEQMGLLSNASQKINHINAPMPGLIIDIMVKEGQEIKEGDQLFILSAMKMENIIVAPGDGIVKEITAKTDDAVEKGQLIIELE